jgi:hypothetical protein
MAGVSKDAVARFANGLRRRADRLTAFQSPRINASFFTRDHPLIFRSTSMASEIFSKCSANTNVTGRRDAV